ncbi:MAG: hypothetical protein RLZZ350_135, partial [Verrucomicrobiota bacterium]
GITSTDLRTWSSTAAIFPSGPPAWTSNSVPGFAGYVWAPDVAYFNGRYNLYFACSIFGTINSAIGLVTTPSLTAPVWTDQGKVIQSNPSGATNATTDLTAYNCIDPAILVDTNGSVWMSFGSYSDGLLVMQLDPATGNRLAPNSPITKIASSSLAFFNNTEEASFLYQRGGYYYLFVNFGGCCAGVDSTYNLRVGRSASVTGPYLDKSGANLIGGGGTVLLESIGRFVGPGHAGILNDNGTNWFTYHYYDAKNNGAPTVGLNQLFWTTDNWPTLTNDWSALYTFSTDAREHRAQFNGAFTNAAALTNDATRGKVLGLGGSNQAVVLPAAVGNASTFAAWVKWNGGADWQRVFDFGSNATKYCFLTPRTTNGRLRFTISTNGNAGEKIIEATTALATGAWQHVAVSLDGARGWLYLNGQPVATNNNLTLRPWQLLTRSNYVGQSQFPADPFFNGEVASLRIFGRALGPSEIRDLAWTHPALAHRYSFTSNANDSIGQAHGALVGNAVITNGAVKLTGANGGYVNLPGGLVSGSGAVTVEFWATFGVNGNWSRVFDFGNISGGNGSRYFFFTPHTSVNSHRAEISVTAGTVNLDAPATLDNRTVHVAVIFDPANNYQAFYTNGVLEKSAFVTLPALTGVNASWAFLGRSLFTADAWLNATIDEFRIYDGRLTPADIAANYQFGPDTLALPVTLAATNAPGALQLIWPDYAVGFTAQTRDTTNAAWTNFPTAPTLTNATWQLTLPATNAAQLFRLRR